MINRPFGVSYPGRIKFKAQQRDTTNCVSELWKNILEDKNTILKKKQANCWEMAKKEEGKRLQKIYKILIPDIKESKIERKL